MADNPIALQNYNTLLKKLLNTKGRDPLEDLGGLLVPTIALEQDRPEWAILKGTALCCGRVLTGGLAANNSASGIRPPAGTNRITVVTGFLLNPAAAAYAIDVRFRTPQVATGVIATPTLFRTDLRQLALGGPVLLPSPATVGLSVQLGVIAGTGPIFLFNLPATASLGAVLYLPLPSPIILDGNSELLVWNTTVAASIDISFFFYERSTEQSEIPTT